MYARTTDIRSDPSSIDQGVAMVRDEILPAVMEMPGCVGMSMLADRQSGRCIATTAWESEAAMRDSAEAVRPLRDRVTELMDSSTTAVDQWEVVGMHRAHAAGDGACSRVSWMRVDPADTDRALDVFKMAVIPRAEEFRGFCSASLMIDRASGRSVATFTYDSLDDLAATRDAATALRDTVRRDLGATVEDVAEFELVLAHLHVPELA